ncbi:hypothetical protein [Candidatus Synchoanobacter obligatus]|uniref:MetA-pathway of phenol degradation n=1 Tax=Candidatus Synchoanobacter obligatus TaxID=2919597 RepID=A0ABT1L508_9GAMM|nr:hypothetical protein [Candidatus Synchoanobacter obligatus]MCP8352256.1 hypothetical protein [Candidatus Synchoanobacter obligatus]
MNIKPLLTRSLVLLPLLSQAFNLQGGLSANTLCLGKPSELTEKDQHQADQLEFEDTAQSRGGHDHGKTDGLAGACTNLFGAFASVSRDFESQPISIGATAAIFPTTAHTLVDVSLDETSHTDHIHKRYSLTQKSETKGSLTLDAAYHVTPNISAGAQLGYLWINIQQTLGDDTTDYPQDLKDNKTFYGGGYLMVTNPISEALATNARLQMNLGNFKGDESADSKTSNFDVDVPFYYWSVLVGLSRNGE